MSIPNPESLDPQRRELLSSHLDAEASSAPRDIEDTQDAAQLVQEHFGSQVHYRNLETIRRATQQNGAAPNSAPAGHFLDRVMGALDDIEQIDAHEDLECLSAHYDLQSQHNADKLDELRSEELNTSETAQNYLHNLSCLSQALQALPQQSAPADFLGRVRETLNTLEQNSFEALSAAYDADEALSPAVSQNFQALSNAIQALPSYEAPAGFAESVLAALPAESVEFETVSACFDGEATLSEAPSAVLHNLEALSQALQALPQMQAPEGFAEGVLQAIGHDFESLSAQHDGEQDLDLHAADAQTQHNFKQLSTALQALEQPQAPAGFSERVMQALDTEPTLSQFPVDLEEAILFEDLSAIYDAESSMELSSADPRLHNLQALSQALNALTEPTLPADFAAKVMAQIDATSAAHVEELSARFDGEADGALEPEEEAVLQCFGHLSAGLQALSTPAVPEGFAARVMEQIEKSAQAQSEPAQAAKLFALPRLAQALLGNRTGQMIAGFALFGILIFLSQNVMNTQQQGPQNVAAVPTNYIVQVDYQPEDYLFEAAADDPLEIVAENEYNLLIGG